MIIFIGSLLCLLLFKPFIKLILNEDNEKLLTVILEEFRLLSQKVENLELKNQSDYGLSDVMNKMKLIESRLGEVVAKGFDDKLNKKIATISREISLINSEIERIDSKINPFVLKEQEELNKKKEKLRKKRQLEEEDESSRRAIAYSTSSDSSSSSSSSGNDDWSGGGGSSSGGGSSDSW